MGLFSGRGNAKGDKSGVNWALDPVPPHPQWSRHAEPYPSSLTVIEEAISRARIPSDEVDRVSCLVGIWRIVVGQGSAFLERRPEAVRALEAVGQREDCDDDKLWNTFTYFGPEGVAARNLLIEQFNEGRITDVLVELICRGDFQIGLGGASRV
jgi:hypothetical protein